MSTPAAISLHSCAIRDALFLHPASSTHSIAESGIESARFLAHTRCQPFGGVLVYGKHN